MPKKVFIRVLPLVFLFLGGLNSCGAQANSVFYEGLRFRAGGTAGQERAVACFESTLKSRNTVVRSAAANELLSLHGEGAQVSAATLGIARREASGLWADALAVLGTGGEPLREKALAFVFRTPGGGNSGVFPDEAARYVLHECRKQENGAAAADNSPAPFFSEAESAAIDGHAAVSRSHFAEGLVFFRAALAAEPALFFRCPNLLNDLGRCFQYATKDSEGISLFLDWEKNLAVMRNGATGDGGVADDGSENDIRFRLLFFAARIARQRGLYEQSGELFARALPCAPDSAQSDACIWYILDSALSRSPAATLRQIETFIDRWHDAAYFSDILDKLARELAGRRQWKDMITLVSVLHGRADAVSTAKYAWIIGRALEEDLLSPEETRMAETAAAAIENNAGNQNSPQPESPARRWLRIAYNASDPAKNAAQVFSSGGTLLYYRCASAKTLGEVFLNLPETAAAASSGGKNKKSTETQSALMEFLLGFFGNNAAAFAPRYIQLHEGELSAADLRRLAAALNQAELYPDSMRLIAACMEREGSRLGKKDLELLYPRPFQSMVEQYAGETGLAPATLYGLIRTESAFQSGIVSRAGAVGLTQLMPATAGEMAGRIRRQGGPDYTGADGEELAAVLQNPAVNIHIGAVYLAYLNERLEDPLLALLAYNGGMNRVRRWLDAGKRAASRQQTAPLPIDLFLETVEYEETRQYGRKVLAAAAVYGELYYK